jgi:hypothetical protein
VAQADAAPQTWGVASGVTPGFDPTLPPQFDMSKIAGRGLLFQSCSQNLQNTISNSLQSVAGALAPNNPLGGTGAATAANFGLSMGYGINAVCLGSDVGPSADSMTCQTLAPFGTINQSQLRAKASAIEGALAAVQCKKGKLSAIQAELGCLSTQAEMLAQQLSTIQSAYQSNIQRMQQDVQKIDAVIADREAQDQDVLGKLGGGDAKAGGKGLRQIREELQALVLGKGDGATAAIPGQIQELENKIKDIDVQQNMLDDAIAQRTMGLASECFGKRTAASFKCVPNGPPVTAKEYALCRIEQNAMINGKGQIEDNAILKAQAAEKRAALGDLLDKIMGESPQKLAPSQNGQPPQVDPSQPIATLLTAADVEQAYGSDLAALDGNGLQIHDFVMKQVGYCFQRASRTVETEKKKKGTPIAQQQLQIERMKRDINTQGNSMIETNAAKYSEAMTGLTGMNLPLTTSACKGATPQGQISCLRDIQKNAEDLLAGRGRGSAIRMAIKGSDNNTNIVFNCDGLNGCITALENVHRNLGDEKKRVTAFKKDYVLKAKQSVDNFTKQMASMMSAQGNALNSRLQDLNKALSSLGVGGIDIKRVEGEKMEYDENGLPKVPQNSLQLIGGQMNPPMLDVHGDNISGSLAKMADGVKDLDAKLGPLMEAKNRLAMLPAECAGQRAQRAGNQLRSIASELETGNCEYSEYYCERVSRLAELAESVQDVSSNTGTGETDMSGIDSILRSGSGACDSKAKARRAFKDADGDETKLKSLAGETEAKNLINAKHEKCRSISTRLANGLENLRNSRDGIGSNSGRAY